MGDGDSSQGAVISDCCFFVRVFIESSPRFYRKQARVFIKDSVLRSYQPAPSFFRCCVRLLSIVFLIRDVFCSRELLSDFALSRRSRTPLVERLRCSPPSSISSRPAPRSSAVFVSALPIPPRARSRARAASSLTAAESSSIELRVLSIPAPARLPC